MAGAVSLSHLGVSPPGAGGSAKLCVSSLAPCSELGLGAGQGPRGHPAASPARPAGRPAGGDSDVPGGGALV